MDHALSPPAEASRHQDAAAVRPWLLLAVVAMLAVVLRQVLVANTDVSWLLVAGDKVLGGEMLYRDVIETNPPIAVLAYLPGLLLGHLTGLRAEIMIDALSFLGIAVTMVLALRIARGAAILEPTRVWPFVIISAAIFAVMPMQTFSQREHLATLALLPALAALAVRARGDALRAWAVVVAGVGCAVTLAFKPYFVLGVGAGIVTAALQARSWRVLFAPEHWLAGALVVAYGALTWIIWPDYFTIVYPMVRDIYIPMKRPMAEIIMSPGIAVWAAALVLALALRPQPATRRAVVLLASVSAGFAVAYALQQKGWAYQSYPMIALALTALALAVHGLPVVEQKQRTIRSGAIALGAVLFVGAAGWMNDTSDARALIAPVARLNPHPRILILTGEASIGHPLARAVNGEWVSGQQDLWVHEFVARMRRERTIDADTAARLARYEAEERARLIADIKRTPPDVLLVDNLLDGWGAWLKADPELSALLAPFTRVDTVQKIDILTRVR